MAYRGNDSTFLDQLALLRSGDYGGGYAQYGEAIQRKQENETLVELYNKFKVKRDDLMTTDEQVNQFSKDVESAGGLGKDNIPKDVSAGLDLLGSLEKITKMTGVYQPFITAFTQLGEDGREVAKSLQEDLSTKIAIEEKRAQIPFQEMQYQKAKYDIELAKLDIEKTAFDISQAKQDANVQALVSEFISTDEFQKMNLSYNTDTGKYSYNMQQLRDAMFKRFGNNPNFTKAYLAFDDYIRKSTKNFEPPKVTGDGNASYYEKLYNIIGTYNTLRDAAQYVGVYQNSPEKSSIRQAYYNAAANLGIKPDDPRYSFGADETVINAMEDTDAQKDARKVYDIMYNDLGDNKEYYWSAMNQLKLLTRQEQITFDKNLNVPGLPTPLDMSKLITRDNGWYNPYDANAMEHFTQTTKRMEKEAESKKKKESRKGQYLLY